jgi:signal transduction histidine kinase
MDRLLAVFRTLRGRLVLLFLFATVPALLLALYAASAERAAVLQRMQREASLLAQLASREHAHQLDGTRGLLHNLERALAAEPGALAAARCPEFLPALLSGYPQFTTIGILSASGTLLCSARPAPRDVSFADNAAFLRALGSRDIAVGDYTMGPIVGRPVLHVALAVREPRGPVRAVVFVGLDLQWLNALFQQAGLPSEYGLLIADRDGHVLGRSDGVTWPAQPGSVDPALAGVVSSLGTAVLDLPGAGRRFLVAAPMGEIPGVSVIASLPYERVQREASRAFFRTVAGLTVLTLFTICFAMVAAEISVLRVLRALSRTARRFGEGDLAARAEVPPGRGELTELTQAFNAMADALGARQREALEGQGQLRALSQRLAVAREAESGRIARELHDELGQVLTSVKMDVATLERVLTPADSASAAEALRSRSAELSQRIDDAVGFLRRVSSDLRPPVLDRLGLVAALEGLARDLEMRSRLAVVLDVNDVREPVDWLVSITVFRIVQEALTNVVRHADATEVAIDLRGTDEALVLRVRDNGKGIGSSGGVDARWLGIHGMRERCLLVGGTFDISGKPGRGTTIVVRIPHGDPSESHGAHPAG